MGIRPPKILRINIVDISTAGLWLEDEDAGDPWFGFAYRWQLTLSVTPQTHSDPSTNNPYFYDGNDIQIGDWIATGQNGYSVQIYDIVEQTDQTAVVKVEDIERFNTYTDQSLNGSGAPDIGEGYLFQLNDEGMPILVPMLSNLLTAQSVIELQGRFAFRNNFKKYIRVNQPSHGFAVGDIIKPDFANPGKYEKATADSKVNFAIGKVTSINIPGTAWFTFEPFGKLVENVSPELDGAYGDMFYLDPLNPGKVTNVRPTNNAKPIYLRLEKATRAIQLSLPGEDISGDTQTFKVENVADNQLLFVLPSNAFEVLYMNINGIENENYTFDSSTKILTFDPVATGYGVETTDEVFFVYKS